MWNPAPLDRHLIVDHQVRAVVLGHQPGIFAGQAILGQPLATLDDLMSQQLELGEHRLAEDRPSEGLQGIIDQVGPLQGIDGLLQKMVGEQPLVAGRCHLGNENRVLRRGVRLGGRREVGVHGVTGLMRQCEGIVQGRVPVEQQVGMRAVDAHTIGAGTLAGCLMDIDPARAQARRQRVDVSLAKRGQPVQNRFTRLTEVHRALRHRDQRDVEIVGVQVIDAEDPLAQRNVPVQQRTVPPDGLDQIGIDIDRDCFRLERGVER